VASSKKPPTVINEKQTERMRGGDRVEIQKSKKKNKGPFGVRVHEKKDDVERPRYSSYLAWENVGTGGYSEGARHNSWLKPTYDI